MEYLVEEECEEEVPTEVEALTVIPHTSGNTKAPEVAAQPQSKAENAGQSTLEEPTQTMNDDGASEAWDSFLHLGPRRRQTIFQKRHLTMKIRKAVTRELLRPGFTSEK